MAKIRAKARLIENFQVLSTNERAHAFIFDLPASYKGTDIGPTALEAALMSLAGCAATIYALVAKNSNVELERLEVVAEAEKPEDSPKLTSVKLRINVSGNVSDKILSALWRRTEENCPVLYIFRDSIPIEIEFKAATSLEQY
ncbi:MAG: OsmC family protein [Candidatus Bathyarchaeia archaeon]